ncbi:PI-PLC X domain-containing protein 1-like isoform X1 [Daphnia pulicaria]|uniref:PI-PLC X domain-containing protein 1-like isoform X1 n=1 Tax=Daphnia pulicaria TaxID=35523 RepID=UPI001EEBE989|nr:PI-PLC X domain-containing protein 1-like isoform X1 [Daphnia pulicaria]
MSENRSAVIASLLLFGCVISSALPAAPGGTEECWTSPLYPRAESPRVFLTLSPLAKSLPGGNSQQRQIELNWHGNGAASQPGDWIGLYEHDPTNNPTLPLRQIAVATGKNSGYHKTDVQFGFPAVDRHLFAGDSCLGYWIGYVRNGVTVSSNCIKLRPSWMWQNREKLGSVPLYQLFLPGTHNSGSYRPYNGHSSDTVFMRYLICQDEDIFHSLSYGIRYLDVRVGYYPERDDKFWLNHNYARVNPLRFLIEDLKNFLEVTREIVILDFHRFPVGFSQNTLRNRETHDRLVKLLSDKLSDYMVPSSFGPMTTMNDLWAINRTLIIVYADDWTRSSHPFLWPSIPQEWGDKRNVDDLYRYLSVIDHKRFDSDYFWAAMAELTPSTMDVLFRPNDGLRKLADNVARNVTTWYRDLWWKTTSIAAVDFFHSTDIIDVSIDANLKRARCSSAVPTTLSSATTIQQTAAEERSTATDRRRFYLGPRNLDFAESTSETTPISLDTTSPLPRITARRRRPKNNTTAIVELNLPVITNTNFN